MAHSLMMILFQQSKKTSQATHNERIYYDPALISNAVVDRVFEVAYWQSEDKVFGSAEGRGTTWFIQLETMQAALRHYRRGGLFGKFVRDCFWFSGWENTRSFQEYKVLEHLAEQSVNVPKPIAIRTIKGKFFYRADIMSQFIANSTDLVSLLKKDKLDEKSYQNIGQQVRKMHDANVNHSDLNIHNILLDTSGKVWIIDFDKCSIEQEVEDSERWKDSNIDRLLRSFKKELKKANIQWQEDVDWKAFKSGYNFK